jgi:predicted ATP-grasp superfamily ATP-dependent carboligase
LPLVVKARQSYAIDSLDSWGRVWIVDTEAELQELLPRIATPSRFLVEAYFPGEGVGVSVLAEDGRILQAFQHRRLREGRGGSSSYRESEPVDAALQGACEKICRTVRLSGVCMFEFRRDPVTRAWVLLETNARFWGSLPLPLSLGLDFPNALHDLLVHGRQAAPAAYQTGIRSRNLVLDGFNLVSEARRAHVNARWFAQLGSFLAQPIGWLTGRERSDSFVRDDLSPAWRECAAAWRSAREKFGRREPVRRDRRRSDRLRQLDSPRTERPFAPAREPA